jgi:hypothetical protein
MGLQSKSSLPKTLLIPELIRRRNIEEVVCGISYCCNIITSSVIILVSNFLWPGQMITWQELMELELGNFFRSNLLKEAWALLLCTNIKCPLLHC